MDPYQAVGELIQSHGGLCALDQINLPYDRPGAGPAAKFGLGCELYLPAKSPTELRWCALHFLADYKNLFAQKINEFLPRDARRTVKISDDLVQRIEGEYAKYPAETGYSTVVQGAVDIGLPHDDVPPYQARVLLRRQENNRPSFVTASMPVCGDVSVPNFGLLLDAVLRWSALCLPMHGSAGLALIFASGMSQNTRYTLPLMKRFPGLDYVEALDFSMEAGSVHNRIKAVNWLTVLGDGIVGELGGIAPMRTALEPICKVHEYAGGVVIQAGETPQLGDTSKGDIPEAYRMVARYTKSVRFEDYKSRLFRVPDGLDKIAETLAWVRRFD